jgi:hypothetical protein
MPGDAPPFSSAARFQITSAPSTATLWHSAMRPGDVWPSPRFPRSPARQASAAEAGRGVLRGLSAGGVLESLGDLLNAGERDARTLFDGQRMVGSFELDEGPLADRLRLNVSLE